MIAAILVGAALAASSPAEAGAAVNTFGLDLLHSRAAGTGNLVLSPFSIELALGMTAAGAAGETRRQMDAVLHFSAGAVETVLPQLSRDVLPPSEDATVRLEIANRLFGQKEFEFRATFLDFAEKNYGTPLEPLDFSEDPAAAARTINDWVAAHTHDRIRDLVSPDALSALTRLVLVNAIYLKAPWAEPFKEGGTHPLPFHLADGTAADVETMARQGEMGYAAHVGFETVALPYAGGDLQFVIFLPAKADGLPALEQKLVAGDFAAAAAMPTGLVRLALPKFKLTPPALDLKAALVDLGMTHAFDVPPGSANFDGIAPARGANALFISAVLHKAFIDVNEAGTEAAAATAVVMAMRSMRPPEKPVTEVRVDRPFLFAVQHRPSGACLFLGRVTDPR